MPASTLEKASQDSLRSSLLGIPSQVKTGARCFVATLVVAYMRGRMAILEAGMPPLTEVKE